MHMEHLVQSQYSDASVGKITVHARIGANRDGSDTDDKQRVETIRSSNEAAELRLRGGECEKDTATQSFNSVECVSDDPNPSNETIH